jgi:biotin carboxyl carrier protein
LRSFRVQVNGNSYTVSVDQVRKGKFHATIDGATFEIEAVSELEIGAWLVNGQEETIQAHAKSLPVGRVDVWIMSMPFQTSVQVVGIGGYALTPEPQRVVSSGKISALMPGRVTSILVKEGESVAEGSPLLILEAMKMQNEIASPLSGRVKSVLVQEGASVKKDTMLIIIE